MGAVAAFLVADGVAASVACAAVAAAVVSVAEVGSVASQPQPEIMPVVNILHIIGRLFYFSYLHSLFIAFVNAHKGTHCATVTVCSTV